MIALLHAYHLEGSGSNHWTRDMARALCRIGESFLLACIAGHPEDYDFIQEAYRSTPDGSLQQIFKRETPYPGRCVFLQLPSLSFLPVYVSDYNLKGSTMLPMVEMSEGQIEEYITLQQRTLDHAVERFKVTAFNVNHAVLLSVAVQRVHDAKKIPYAIFPHGSAIEYVVKKDPRFHVLARGALQGAEKVFCTSSEMQHRLQEEFKEVPNLEDRLALLGLGVDTALFHQVKRSRRAKAIQKLIGDLKNNWENIEPHRRPLAQSLKDLNKIDWGKEKILIHVGALLPNKGLLVLLEALPEIFKQQPGVRLLVAGKGPLLEELKKKSRPFKDKVLFLGFLPHRYLSQLYPCADVAILPSLIPEAGPLAFLEALASGCLPLGTRQGGMEDYYRVLASALPGEGFEQTGLRPDRGAMGEDLVRQVPLALHRAPPLAPHLAEVAQKYFDWQGKARELARQLKAMGRPETPPLFLNNKFRTEPKNN